MEGVSGAGFQVVKNVEHSLLNIISGYLQNYVCKDSVGY